MDMKTTSEYMALLRKYMVENAHKYGIMRMGIFGSVAREDMDKLLKQNIMEEGIYA